eukprot:1176718-Prorocentrum_minimum.AAC.5
MSSSHINTADVWIEASVNRCTRLSTVSRRTTTFGIWPKESGTVSPQGFHTITTLCTVFMELYMFTSSTAESRRLHTLITTVNLSFTSRPLALPYRPSPYTSFRGFSQSLFHPKRVALAPSASCVSFI